MESVPEWCSRVRFDSQDVDAEEVRLFWEVLGVKPALATELSEVNLRWEDGELRCHCRALQQDDPYGFVGGLVMSLYRIRSFSSCRFLGLGGVVPRLDSGLRRGP